MTQARIFERLPALLPLPPSFSSVVGKLFGRLTALGFTGAHDNHGHRLITCRCSCGPNVFLDVLPSNLRSGNTTSCGCVLREHMLERNERLVKHGDARGSKVTPEYRAWNQMLTRCYNPNHKSFAYYGGRGVEVCERWRQSFGAFLNDVGRRPAPGYSLDRFPNVNGGYEPGNVRWATSKEQNRNQRSTRRFDFRGESLTAAEISERTGVDARLLYERLARYGWGSEEAVQTPPGAKNTDQLYGRWWQMVHRCHDPTHERFKDYGARGITVCERWKTFEAFAKDVGFPPAPSYTIDRIENDRGYEPGNVRWATYSEQNRNRRNTRFHVLEGAQKTLKEWAEIASISYSTVSRRVHNGWPLDEALGTSPIQGVKRRKFAYKP